MKYPALFSPIRIGKLKLKNRLAMPPMVRNYADPKGVATKRYVDHISSLAKGGTGMLILEASFISPEGRGFKHELGLHTDAVIAGLRKLAKAAHEHKAAIGIQVYHAGRQTNPVITGKQPVAPSPIKDPLEPEAPRELKIDEIKKLVKAYAKGAWRAKKAGLDFVELHAAHGYLITQFLSPFTNVREDEYGGTPEKRFRFMQEVFLAVRAAVGPDYPIVVRLSGDEWVKGGLTIKDTVQIAKKLEKLGADALHISSGNYASYVQGKMIPPMAVEDGVLVPLAKVVKKNVKIPVMAVAKIRQPEMAEKIIKSKSADMVAIGRSLLADPEWPNKAKAGQAKLINHCVACNQGCISRLFAQEDVWCTVNPACGREAMFAKPVGTKKRVAVIGGGPGGMSAARVAALRGHKVTLFESHKELGGQLAAAAMAPHRQDWNMLRNFLIAEMKRLKVEVELEHQFTIEDIKTGKFDSVIVAMGSTATRPRITGADRANVVIARDLYEGKAQAKGNVVVVGGGCMGAQTAEYLSAQKHPVTMVEMSDQIAAEAPIDEKYLLLERLAAGGVKILDKTQVKNILEGKVIVKGEHGQQDLPAETVVMCIGAVPNDGLAQKIRYFIKQVKVVGDAVKPRRITDAVLEGALVALDL
jgi:2,4-dienoyl-CoA reductase-like NADH-dependent reductase (Old Yellow Enzyme family)/thioredoxin reductase